MTYMHTIHHHSIFTTMTMCNPAKYVAVLHPECILSFLKLNIYLKQEYMNI